MTRKSNRTRFWEIFAGEDDYHLFYLYLKTSRMKAYLGGHGTYYRYNRGEKLLTPEQQEWILRLFTRYGYSENLSFEGYCDVMDFSE